MTTIMSSFSKNDSSPALWRRLLLPLLAFAWSITLGPSSLFAQSIQNIQHTENKPDLALRSDTRVDPSTLGMSFSIPLASYPGRAGHGLPVAITYSSKSVRLDFTGVDYTPVTGAKTWTTYKFAEHSTAGWTSTLSPPRVEFTGMGQFFDGQGHTACADVCYPGQNIVGDHYIKRIHVHMPDGSSHELRLDDDAHLFPLEPFTGTFQSVDGSRMRFESNAGAPSVLYLPDGSRYLFGPYNSGTELTATNFIDRNGNTLTYNATSRQWTDTLNRVIPNPLPASPIANTETYFLAKLVGGTDAAYTFRWKYLADVLTPDPATGQPPPLSYPGDNKCAHNSYQTVYPYLFTSNSDTKVCVEQDQFGNPVLFNPVVLSEIVLPTGKFYRFTYTVYGEIDKILLTTGATDSFRYDPIPTLSWSAVPYSQINRGVVERRMSATGNASDESVWTYTAISSNTYMVRTTRPDLSYSERLLHRSRYTSGSGVFASFDFDDVRMGMTYEERSYNSSGVMLRRQLSKWVEGGTPGGAARDPKVTRQVSIILDDAGSNALTATTVNRYEQASQPLNLTSTIEYGFDNSMSKATAQTAGVDSFNPADSLAIRTTETAYLDNTDYNARNLVSLPTSVTIKSGMPVSGQVIARSEMLYDELALLPYSNVGGWGDPGAVARGNVTKVKTWLNTLGGVTNSNAYLARQTQYDQCGNVRKIWDARDTTLSNPTQIEYSHQFSYPTLNTSADPDGSGPLAALTTATEYDVNTGLVTATVDANGQRTTFSYDNTLNRLKQVVRAATDADAKNQTTYSYNDTALTITATSDLNSYPDNLLKTVTKYDGLGRMTETQTFEDGTNYIATQQQYDTSGRVFKSSNPFRNGTPVWTTTTYDSLDRVLTVSTPDNAVITTSYSGNTVTVTDQAGKLRRGITDALGRLTRVDEPDSGNSLGDVNNPNQPTSYSYDTLDNLVKVTQGSQQRFFMYDSLKRLIRARNPEQGTRDTLALSDPITGNSAWSLGYEYDENGNLTKKTDARGVYSLYVYDALNRNTEINYSDTLISPDVKRFYDGATKGLGRFWYDSKGDENAANNFEKTTINSFDALGRPLSMQQSFKLNSVSKDYSITRTYNRAGGVLTQSYPAPNRGVAYTYDSAGRIASFSGNLGGEQRSYASAFLYSAHNQVTQELFGTQTALYHKRQYNIRGQLWDVRVSTGADVNGSWNRGCLQFFYESTYSNGASGPGNNGNVLKTKNYVPLDEQTNTWAIHDQFYSYDSLNRISSVAEYFSSSTQPLTQQSLQSYSYDRYGNRTIAAAQTWGTGINNKQFDIETATNRLAVPGNQSGTMSYDSAGNLTNDTYTGAGAREYDAENQMTRAWGGNSQWQEYTYNADGQRTRRKVNGSETWQIYGMDGELLAEYTAGSSTASPLKEYGYRNGQLLVTIDAPPTMNGYVYQRAITIDHTKVPNTDQTNFPVLISGTYSYLATTANSGNVQNTNGYDVIFASDSSCVTKLNHEVETYNATTGAVNYWVKVPLLSHTTDTTIYLCYGNASITTDQSNKTGVWDTNYKGVWHLPNGTTLNASDSTANGNSGTITGAVATAGKTDGSASLNGTSDHIQVKAGKVDTSTTTGTVSAWVKLSALDKNGVVLGYGGADVALWGVYIREESGSYYFATASRKTNGGVYNTVRGNTALTSGTWYYVTFSTNGSVWKIRVNGATAQTLTTVLGTNTGDWIGDVSPATPDKSDLGGIYAGGAYSSVNYWNGTVDEVRLSNLERSDDWVSTEYNNQNSPSTFYTIASVTGGASQAHWLVTDHLGTPRIIIDQTGSLASVSRHDYLPFGEELYAGTGGRSTSIGYTGDGVRQHFTSKERDSESGLDYFVARYYSSTQGRFSGADPYNPILSSEDEEDFRSYLNQPQHWNRFSYVSNNPIKYVDPTGELLELTGDIDAAFERIKALVGDARNLLYIYKKDGHTYVDYQGSHSDAGQNINALVKADARGINVYLAKIMGSTEKTIEFAVADKFDTRFRTGVQTGGGDCGGACTVGAEESKTGNTQIFVNANAAAVAEDWANRAVTRVAWTPDTGRVWFENDVVDAHEFGHAFANAFEGKQIRLSDQTYERARQFENHQRKNHPTRRKYTRIRE